MSRSITQELWGPSHVERNKYRKFLSRAQSAMRDWWKLIEDYGTRTDKPMKPQVVAWELGKCLAEDAITPCDSGTVATWWARHIPTKRGQMHSLSGNLASMAPALPYAIAAQIAYPDRQSVAFVGDGGFSMLMAEFATCVKYKLPVKVFVIKNNSLGQIKWEQMVFLGNPEYGCDLQPINFALFAQACGGTGLTVDDPKDCGRVCRSGFEHARSCARRSGCRSLQATDATEGVDTASRKVRGVAAARRTEPYKDRGDDCRRSSSRAGLKSSMPWTKSHNWMYLHTRSQRTFRKPMERSNGIQPRSSLLKRMPVDTLA